MKRGSKLFSFFGVYNGSIILHIQFYVYNLREIYSNETTIVEVAYSVPMRVRARARVYVHVCACIKNYIYPLEGCHLEHNILRN